MFSCVSQAVRTDEVECEPVCCRACQVHEPTGIVEHNDGIELNTRVKYSTFCEHKKVTSKQEMEDMQ